MILGTPASFAVERLAVCRWCAEPIERRRLLGWLHVNGFYTCAGQTDPPYSDAEPGTPELADIRSCRRIGSAAQEGQGSVSS
jgi:hypothetical protein